MTDKEQIDILLVEDNEMDRIALERFIKRNRLPYRLQYATNVKQAIVLLNKDIFDLILLDYNLKTSTGFDLLPYTGDTPVVFITGSGSEEIAVSAMKKGASDYLIKDPAHNYLKVLPITIRNVLEQKKAERALFRSEEFLKTTLRSISDLVFGVNLEGKISDFLQSSDHPDLYVKPDFFLGKSIDTVLPPEQAQLLTEANSKALYSEETQLLEYWLDIKGKRQWFEARCSARKNKEGSVCGTTLVVCNISKRKQAEADLNKARQLLEQRVEDRTHQLMEANQKLKKSEERLNKFMNSATEAFFFLDAQLNFVDVNKVGLKLLKMEQEDVLGKNLVDIIPEALGSGRLERYHETISTGKPFIIENYIYPIAIRKGTGILNAFKVGDGLGIILIDTTRRKQLEEELRQAQKMEAIGSLAGGIAHDFNNILGIIIGYTELAQDDVPHDSRTWSNLEQVLAASARAREMIKQILAFSRKVPQERKTIYLSHILDETLKLLKSTIPSNIEIRVNKGSSLHPIMADATQIQQVIMNISANAAYAMKDRGGVLSISLEEINMVAGYSHSLDLEPGMYQKLSFSDTGHGMSPETIRRIFEPYYTTKSQGQGTGMGLAVAHGILKSHGGDIQVYSEPGKGTTFHIYLPPTTLSAAEVTPIRDRFVGGNERILLVDDEPPLLEISQQMLKKLGYRVEARADSLEALELFKKNPQRFDIIVTDQAMPNLTGIQLAAKLREIRSDIPVILCTGFSEQISEENFRTYQINGFVMKPLVKKEIDTVIRMVLDEKYGQ